MGLMGPMGPGGFRRRGRRRGLVVGAAVGAAAANRNQPNAQPEEQAVPAAPAASSQDDQVAELQKLAQLKDQGILTEEEFAAKKKQILGL